MTDNKLVNRIPFEDIASAKVWALPALNSGRVVPSVKKPNPRDENKAREEKKAGTEIIEEVAEPVIKPLTADQLQQIAAQAEEEGRERGYQEGVQKGYNEGEKKGLQIGQQKAYSETKAALEDQTRRFQQIADALLDPLATQNSRLDNIVLDMAVHLAKHLLSRELSENPSSLFHLVERAVGALPAGAKNIRIYLHPDDVELAHEAFTQLGRTWTFFADATMSRGGCRLETDQSLVDYSVEQRLQQMLEQADFLGDLEAGEEIPVADYTPPEPEPLIDAAPLGAQLAVKAPLSAAEPLLKEESLLKDEPLLKEELLLEEEPLSTEEPTLTEQSFLTEQTSPTVAPPEWSNVQGSADDSV